MNEKLTLKQLSHYGLAVLLAIGLMSGLFFGIKAIVHEATKERPHFNTGKIMQKDYHAAHYNDWLENRYIGQSCSGSGSTQVCTSLYMPVWHHDYVPDSWSIQIENCNVLHKDGRQWVDKQGNNKCFKKWIDVDQTTYNGVNLNEDWNG